MADLDLDVRSVARAGGRAKPGQHAGRADFSPGALTEPGALTIYAVLALALCE